MSKLTVAETAIAVAALRVAAARYTADAFIFHTQGTAPHPRLFEQFAKQAAEAYALADKLEDA